MSAGVSKGFTSVELFSTTGGVSGDPNGDASGRDGGGGGGDGVGVDFQKKFLAPREAPRAHL